MPNKLISETLGYLLAQTCKAHRGAAVKLLTELGLYAGQETILGRLWQQDGLTQTELTGQLCVQAATVTKMLNRMVKAGLVERRGDPDDQRVSRVYLTERGRDLQQPVQDVWRQLDETAFASMTPEERMLFRRLLMQVQANLNK